MSTWIRVDMVPARFRSSLVHDRITTRYRWRSAACHLRKACRPVPCPPFGEARFTVLATSVADQKRRIHAAGRPNEKGKNLE